MALAALVLGAAAWSSVARAQTLDDPNLVVETLAPAGLSQPTGLRFIGPSDAFVIEKNTGKVKLLQGASTTEVLDLAVSHNGERGLLGIETHPQFDQNGFVYLYYSAPDGSDDSSVNGDWQDNRLERYVWDEQAVSLTKDATFQDFVIPRRAGEPNGPNHDGGPISFGLDGKLYLQTGDLNRNRAEQNFSSDPLVSAATGGIYRFNDDGTTPNNNPFLGQTNPELHALYAYGVRNGFGMTVDPDTGSLWDTENGPNLMDEINLITAGFNSGWEILMGPDSRDESGSVDDLLDLLPVSSYSDPEFSFADPIAITSISFLFGSALGAAYDDAVLVGDNNARGSEDRALYLFRLNEARDGFVFTAEQQAFCPQQDPLCLEDLVADSEDERLAVRIGSGFGVVTDIQTAPDGTIHVLSLTHSAIHRISLVPEPRSFSLVSLGLLALACRRRRGVLGS